MGRIDGQKFWEFSEIRKTNRITLMGQTTSQVTERRNQFQSNSGTLKTQRCQTRRWEGKCLSNGLVNGSADTTIPPSTFAPPTAAATAPRPPWRDSRPERNVDHQCPKVTESPYPEQKHLNSMPGSTPQLSPSNTGRYIVLNRNIIYKYMNKESQI